MVVTIYQPAGLCNQCSSTKLKMKKPGKDLPAIPFTAITVDDQMADQLRAEGYSSFPVVKVDLDDQPQLTWSGFRMEEIIKLAKLIR